MGQYKGIFSKKLTSGTTHIYARFNYDGIAYPNKNFTKLYGCETEYSAKLKLDEIKILIGKGKNPFAKTYSTLKEIFEDRKEQQVKNGYWVYSTARSYAYFFKNHINKEIGYKKIEKITYEDIMKIIDKFRKDQTGSKNTIIDILKPIFKEEFKKGNIQENIMLKIDKYTVKVQKENLQNRTSMKNIEIMRSLYNAISNLHGSKPMNLEKHKMFLYMLILTAHRFGELTQLERKNCLLNENKIIAPKEITKTREEYHYPIPDECIEFVKTAPNGKLWYVPRGGTAIRLFNRLLNRAKIKTYENHTITMHDTRKIMISIMINDLGIDSRLADYCLDHKPQGTIKHYLEFTYDDKVKAYKKYWNYIKNDTINIDKNNTETIDNSSSKSNTTTSNIDKLDKLIEMLKNDYITKEQFNFERDKLYC